MIIELLRLQFIFLSLSSFEHRYILYSWGAHEEVLFTCWPTVRFGEA